MFCNFSIYIERICMLKKQLQNCIDLIIMFYENNPIRIARNYSIGIA